MEGKKHSLTTDYMMKILGLDICADTVVGDGMLRGISGGQKKRVTTGKRRVILSMACFRNVQQDLYCSSHTRVGFTSSLNGVLHALVPHLQYTRSFRLPGTT